MILFGSTLSAYVRKVAAYAVEKGIELDLKSIGLGDPNPDFRAASPMGKMPALVDGGFSLADSSAIIHYLEARFPEPALIPADPYDRGRAVWFDEWADTILFPCVGKMFLNRVIAPRFFGREGDMEAANAAELDELPPLLDYLESVIPDSGYLVGERLTFADLAVASPFANLRLMDFEIEGARHPGVATYAAAILARPSFASIVENERAILARPRN